MMFRFLPDSNMSNIDKRPIQDPLEPVNHFIHTLFELQPSFPNLWLLI